MYCIYCGAQNNDNALYCQQCHHTLPPRAVKSAASGQLSPESGPYQTGQLPLYPEPASHGSSQPFASVSSFRQERIASPYSASNRFAAVPWRQRYFDQAILAGVLLICIGFFLPWIELNIPLLSLPSLSGINGGLFSWPLLFLALAQVGLVLFEQRLVQWQPVLRSWLHILPLVFGALFVMRACDLITLAIGLSNLIQSFLSGFSSASSSMRNFPSFIMPGAGDFLMLLGGLLLMISAGWRLAQAWRAVSVENG